MRILFTGGGTGGHIFPIVAVARELKKIDPELELFFLGPADFKDVLEKEGIKAKAILAAKLRRYFSFRTLSDLFKAPLGFIHVFWHLFVWMPDAIFSKGGYGSVPTVLIGWLFRIPIIIHESDTVPGLANVLAGKLAKRIGVSFSSAATYFPAKKTALIGNPIRSEILAVCLSNDEQTKAANRQIMGITSQKPVIFVFGGSQGSQKINEIILSLLSLIVVKYELIHQCGESNYQAVKAASQANVGPGYHLFPFLDEKKIKAAYLLADLVISRAGGSIFEIAACAKPSILIPLPNSAGEHQKKNAFAFAQNGGAIVLEQDNLTDDMLWDKIERVLNNPDLAGKMAAGAKSFAKPEAARKIAEELIELGK